MLLPERILIDLGVSARSWVWLQNRRPAGRASNRYLRLLGRVAAAGVDYRLIEVTASSAAAEALLTAVDRPAFPLLLHDGVMIGDAEDVEAMLDEGEFDGRLRVLREEGKPDLEKATMSNPKIQLRFTERAHQAVADARQADDPQWLRFEVSSSFQHGLAFDEKRDDDLELSIDGITVIVDPQSATRADGTVVDFTEVDGQAGFKIENPNKTAETTAVPGKLDRDTPPELTVTDAAMAQFRVAIEEEDDPAAACIVVNARRMGTMRCEYELDIMAQKERGDAPIAFEHDGIAFFVDARSAYNLDGATIDFVDDAGRSGFKFVNPTIEAGWSDKRAEAVEKLLDDEINPGIAAHGGYVKLLDVLEDTIWIHMGGGCQGCGMAGQTLDQGIRDRVKEIEPSIRHIVDGTDHSAGTNPYYR